MTPDERRLIDDLFDRLATLENAPRDPEAERAIIDGLRHAPNAAYALVQTALLQDEALKRANARIEELENNSAPQQPSSGSFLDSMRNSVWGQNQSHGSVPNVRPADNAAPPSGPVWNSGQVLNSGYADPRSTGYAPAPGYGAPSTGGSFLGTAAAAAAGMIGGSLLMGSIRGLMGNHQAFADTAGASNDTRSPWSADQSNSELARDAGVNDISGDRGTSKNDQSQGLFDNASNDDNQHDDGFDAGDFDGGDGFDGGDSGDI
jgi:hypothetical protein